MTRDVTSYERRPFDGWLLLGALAVFLASLAIARSGDVPWWERAIFHGINGLPEWLYRPMWLLQLVGLLLVPLVVAVVAASGSGAPRSAWSSSSRSNSSSRRRS